MVSKNGIYRAEIISGRSLSAIQKRSKFVPFVDWIENARTYYLTHCFG